MQEKQVDFTLAARPRRASPPAAASCGCFLRFNHECRGSDPHFNSQVPDRVLSPYSSAETSLLRYHCSQYLNAYAPRKVSFAFSALQSPDSL